MFQTTISDHFCGSCLLGVRNEALCNHDQNRGKQPLLGCLTTAVSWPGVSSNMPCKRRSAWIELTASTSASHACRGCTSSFCPTVRASMDEASIIGARSSVETKGTPKVRKHLQNCPVLRTCCTKWQGPQSPVTSIASTYHWGAKNLEGQGQAFTEVLSSSSCLISVKLGKRLCKNWDQGKKLSCGATMAVAKLCASVHALVVLSDQLFRSVAWWRCAPSCLCMDAVETHWVRANCHRGKGRHHDDHNMYGKSTKALPRANKGKRSHIDIPGWNDLHSLGRFAAQLCTQKVRGITVTCVCRTSRLVNLDGVNWSARSPNRVPSKPDECVRISHINPRRYVGRTDALPRSKQGK